MNPPERAARIRCSTGPHPTAPAAAHGRVCSCVCARAALLAAMALVMAGCSGGPRPATGPGAAGRAGAGPPLVPAGVDTSVVVRADSVYGEFLGADALRSLATAEAELARTDQAVDTLATISRWVRTAAVADGDPAAAARPHARAAVLAPADSFMVADLLLRADAKRDPVAAAAVAVHGSLRRLTSEARRAGDLGAQMAGAGDDPARAAAAAETRTAVRGLSAAGRQLHDRLEALLAQLRGGAAAADSARVQQEVSELVRAYGRELDDAINLLGRTAQEIGPTSLSGETLAELAAALEEQRSELSGFRSRWDLFRTTGSLALGDPERPFDPGPMTELLVRMGHELDELAATARARAAALEGAGDIRVALEARRDAEAYLVETQRALLDLKQDTARLVATYQRAASSYWEQRLTRAAAARHEREQLYRQLDDLVNRQGVKRIRSDDELLATFRRLSDRLIERRRQRVAETATHDQLRGEALENLAADLDRRARVLGAESDYADAERVWEAVVQERPGDPAPVFRLASLVYEQTQEPWAARSRGDLREQVLTLAARAERLVLERFAYGRAMEAAGEELAAAGTAAGDTTSGREVAGPQAAAGEAWRPDLLSLVLADSNYHYAPRALHARRELAALGPASSDPVVRGWLLNLDALRRRVAFDAGSGEEFLRRYAREAWLDTALTAAEARRVLRFWSWDDGHLSLRRRWAEVVQLPDSTADLLAVKREAVAEVLDAARTTGARRQAGWTLAALDFERPGARDAGLERMHLLLEDIARKPTPEPEAGAIDSTVVAAYPVYLFNRGTYWEQEGRGREAFYCYLAVAEEYARDPWTRATARYAAAAVLADGNRRGALDLVRTALADALTVAERDPDSLEPTLLVRMHELRRRLAGELALYEEAIAARAEAQRLRRLLEGDGAPEAAEAPESMRRGGRS
ncbi:MAG: hypothetical protein R6X25_04210 [Candidatus Krumholzibacteriia bacterium]